jgi:hypothetical protein
MNTRQPGDDRKTDDNEPLRKSLEAIELDAGWLYDNVPDRSPDGVATLRDIAREIAKTAYLARTSLDTREPRWDAPDAPDACPPCQARFWNASALMDHERYVHGAPDWTKAA